MCTWLSELIERSAIYFQNCCGWMTSAQLSYRDWPVRWGLGVHRHGLCMGSRLGIFMIRPTGKVGLRCITRPVGEAGLRCLWAVLDISQVLQGWVTNAQSSLRHGQLIKLDLYVFGVGVVKGHNLTMNLWADVYRLSSGGSYIYHPLPLYLRFRQALSNNN